MFSCPITKFGRISKKEKFNVYCVCWPGYEYNDSVSSINGNTIDNTIVSILLKNINCKHWEPNFKHEALSIQTCAFLLNNCDLDRECESFNHSERDTRTGYGTEVRYDNVMYLLMSYDS